MSEPMTPERLQGIKSLVEGTTPGDWAFHVNDVGEFRVQTYDVRVVAEIVGGGDYVDANTNFIANAHQDIPDLLLEVARLKALVRVFFAHHMNPELHKISFEDLKEAQGVHDANRH